MTKTANLHVLLMKAGVWLTTFYYRRLCLNMDHSEDFSDHFPVRCNMSFRSQRRVNNDTKLPDWTYTTFKWNETHTDSFVEKLTSLYAAQQ